jgi:D-aminopeptidase
MDLSLLALERRIDALLAPLHGGPGATIGVARGGQLLTHRSAGLASIESEVPIGPHTLFRVASVSKQFTCAAALLLARDGLLDPADALARHLDGLPEWAGAVTLEQLMRNSAGLRDMLELLRAGGTDLAHPVGAAQIDAAIARSAGVNFASDARFLYSNTNFRLLGRVVERVSGMPLRDFLDARIFAPLGMTRTRHTPDVLEPVPGLATGYTPRGRAPHGFDIGGEGGLVSCVEDLLIWAAAQPRVMPELTLPGSFANGLPNAYLRGLEAEAWRDRALIGHGGLWPGYKTAYVTLPAESLAVVAISNNAATDPAAMAHAALEAALGLAPLPPPRAPEGFGGSWRSSSHATFDLYADASGRPMARQHGVVFALAPEPDGLLHARRGGFRFALDWAGAALHLDAGVVEALAPAAPGPVPAAMAGSWRCEDVAATWHIGADGGFAVEGPLNRTSGLRVEGFGPDIARAHMPGALYDPWWDVRVLDDATLEVNGARARGLRFARLA